ncbi:MAG: hypothetical protein IT448_01030 [Phycisphaerales bacterium]|nr:hypothetical protein [Phycisphaerales bacterium]
MSTKQDINGSLLVTIAIAFAVFLIFLVFALQAWFLAAEQSETQAKFDAAHNTVLEQMLAEQNQRLTTTGYSDGKASIPIEQAMQVIVKNKGALPAASSGN